LGNFAKVSVYIFTQNKYFLILKKIALF
jgi:hypothetical protein